MIEQIKMIGASVPGYETHGWRRHQMAAFVNVLHEMDVSRITVDGNIDLIVQQGPESVTVAGPNEAAIRNITHSLVLGHLRFEQQFNTTSHGKGLWPFNRKAPREAPRVVVVVTVPFIPLITHQGNGDVYVYDVSQDDLMLVMMGTGRIFGWGKVNGLAANLSGSGEVDLRDLRSQMTIAVLSGSGVMNVHAAHAAKTRLTGSGKIYVHGGPEQKTDESLVSGAVEYV